MWCALLITLFLVAFFCFLWFTQEHIPPIKDLRGHHVIITGGSSGIGLSTAQKFVKLGAHVTILARDQKRLDDAKDSLSSFKMDPSQKILAISTDVGNSADVEKNIARAAKECGERIDILITSAGASRPGKMDEVPLSEFERLMKINYLGTIYAINAVLPYMKKQRQGRLILVSSMAGLAGIVGFAAYTPTKFALRGLAETLHMELKPFNISVSVSFPPDVDTPMLKEEMQYKPEETRLISEGAGLFSADQVASDIVLSVTTQWKFFIVEGIDGFLLESLTVGFAPSPSVLYSLRDILLLPIARLIALGYLKNFDRLISTVHKKKELRKQ